MRQVTGIVPERQLYINGRIMARLPMEDIFRIFPGIPIGFFSCRHPKGCSMLHASWLRQVEFYLKGYGHGWPGVCLGDGQTGAGVPSRDGRGDALFRRMPPTF